MNSFPRVLSSFFLLFYLFIYFYFSFLASQNPGRENAQRPNQQQHRTVKDDFLSHHADTWRASCQTRESWHFRVGCDFTQTEGVFVCKFKFCTWLLSVFARDAAPCVPARSPATQRPRRNQTFLCAAENEPKTGLDVTKSQASCSQTTETNSIQEPSCTVEAVEIKLTVCLVHPPIYHCMYYIILFHVLYDIL